MVTTICERCNSDSVLPNRQIAVQADDAYYSHRHCKLHGDNLAEHISVSSSSGIPVPC